jgi:hypothetical protein
MELGALDSDAHVEYDDYPLVGILKLQHWLNLQFQGICWLLGVETFESIAFGMTRGLLEGWAHLWWVRGTGADGRKCRGLRLDQMFAREELESVLATREEELIAPRRARVKHLEEVVSRFGCTDQPRKLGGVVASLREIGAHTGNWPEVMYRQTSLVAHQVGYSWMVVDDEQGHNAFRVPTVVDRAVRLYHVRLSFITAGRSSWKSAGPANGSPPGKSTTRNS